MRVHRIQLSHENDISFELLDENDQLSTPILPENNATGKQWRSLLIERGFLLPNRALALYKSTRML
jgi:hypothetical protein